MAWDFEYMFFTSVVSDGLKTNKTHCLVKKTSHFQSTRSDICYRYATKPNQTCQISSRRNYINKQIPQLVRNDAITIYDQFEILNETMRSIP